MTPVVEKLGSAVDDWVAAHHAPAGRHPPAPARPPRARLRRVRDHLLPGAAAARRTGSSRGGCPPAPASCATSGSGDPVVVLRADIDALPLADLKDVPYASTREGLCHACGHDVHTTVVLGVAVALAALDGLPGTVRCVFQPAEETVPGGATEVVASGVLDGASRAFALHCDPSVPAGKIGLRTGADHRGLRPHRRHAARPRRAHRPAAAHRRPGRRPRPADHRPPGAAVPPGRPARRDVAGVGRGQRRHRGQRDPAARPAPRHGAGARPGRLAGRRGPDALAGRARGRDHRRRGRRRLRPRRAPGGQRPPRGRADAGGRAGDRGQRPPRPVAAEHGRGGLRLVRRRHADRAGPAGHPRRRSAAGPAPRHLRRRRAGDRRRCPAARPHRAARAGGRRRHPVRRRPTRPHAAPAPGDTSARRAVDERREPDDESHRPADRG